MANLISPIHRDGLPCQPNNIGDSNCGVALTDMHLTQSNSNSNVDSSAIEHRITNSRDKIAQQFKEFVDRRTKEKKYLYTNVVYTGWGLVVLGLILFSLSLNEDFQKLGEKDENLSRIYISFYTLCIFSGILVFSTVPTVEINLDNTNANLRKIIHFLSFLAFLFFGLHFTMLLPYFCGILLLLFSLSYPLYKFLGSVPTTTYVIIGGLLYLFANFLLVLVVFIKNDPNYAYVLRSNNTMFNFPLLRFYIPLYDRFHIACELFLQFAQLIFIVGYYIKITFLKVSIRIREKELNEKEKALSRSNIVISSNNDEEKGLHSTHNNSENSHEEIYFFIFKYSELEKYVYSVIKTIGNKQKLGQNDGTPNNQGSLWTKITDCVKNLFIRIFERQYLIFEKYSKGRSLTELREKAASLNSDVIYMMIHSYLVMLGFIFAVVGLQICSGNWYYSNPLSCYLQTLYGLVFIVFFIIGGLYPDKIFKFMARRFEFSVRRSLEDGAHLGALVAKSFDLYEKGDVYWLKRKDGSPQYNVFEMLNKVKKMNSTYIKRQFWIKSRVKNVYELRSLEQELLGIQLELSVDIDIDDDLSWNAEYKGLKINEVQTDNSEGVALYPLFREKSGSCTILPTDVSDDLWKSKKILFYAANSRSDLKPIEKWANENIEIDIEKDTSFNAKSDQNAKRELIVKQTIKPSISGNAGDPIIEIRTTHKTTLENQEKERLYDEKFRKKFLEYGFTSIRKLKYENFRDDFFTVSPRELKAEDKSKIFACSDEVKLVIDDNNCAKNIFEKFNHMFVDSLDDKIDYFISHAWEDDGSAKTDALRAFADEFKKINGRYPTFWLDKTCIDQSKSSMGVAALPINIGVCHKVLVILGKSYLKRIWCIWELFTLMCFCNKELALERIAILPLEGWGVLKDMESFADILNNKDDAGSINSHCFDPNEEYKLRMLIKTIGEDKVAACLSDIRDIFQEKMKQSLGF